MKSLVLTTRYREGAFEGDACLLVYDVASISGSVVGDDVRDVLERRPNTARIFVLAPFLNSEEVDQAITDGSALQRAGANWPSPVTEISVLKLSKESNGFEVVSQALSLKTDGGTTRVIRSEWIRLAPELREGWLFCLFDMYGGLVNAPIGVHFSKASGKHADKFLRTSSVLLSTDACGLLAFFSISLMPKREPRRIFVDTAPLIAIAQAMHRIARNIGIWTTSPPVRSFSSHGGVGLLPLLGRNDLMLVSASTSGGLANLLLDLGIAEDMLITMYFLLSSSQTKTRGVVVCDLTHTVPRTFGYPPVESLSASTCKLCRKGFVVAELEGDQFLIERRGVKRLRIGAASQIGTARETLEEISRKNLINVRLHKEDSRRSDIEIDARSIISASGHLHNAFNRLLTRFTPTPLHFVVTSGISLNDAHALLVSAGLNGHVSNAQFVEANNVETLLPKIGANALVLVDYLSDHALLRGVNAQLRSKVGGGSVAYLSGLTIADSPRNLADLRIFLQYGEHGPETFIFRSASELMLPWPGDRISPWVQELQMLRKISGERSLPDTLQNRLDWLTTNASTNTKLFLAGKNGDLRISQDFVLLDTSKNHHTISQADVYAVVCNSLAAERCDRNHLGTAVQRTQPTPVWGQSIYVQSVICPSNFRDFNDAVLRAALLRSANQQELNYTVDEVCSDEMYEVIRADVLAWNQGKGDSLAEFLVSLSCGRLRLQNQHIERLKLLIEKSDIAEFLKVLASHIHLS